MYARVAKWEGAEAAAIRSATDEIGRQASSGPPDGVPAKGFLLLRDPENGRAMAIALFETEDDLRQGNEVLDSMSPPDDGLGRRTSVETYEVATDVRM